MSTIREQIVAAAVTALNTSRPGSVPNAVERARTFAIEVSALPSIIVYPKRDQVFDVGGRRGPIVRRVMTLAIECRAKGAGATTCDAAVDPLCAWVVKALSDQTLGGLVNEFSESETGFEYEQADNPVCLATVLMEVEYQSRAADAELRA